MKCDFIIIIIIKHLTSPTFHYFQFSYLYLNMISTIVTVINTSNVCKFVKLFHVDRREWMVDDDQLTDWKDLGLHVRIRISLLQHNNYSNTDDGYALHANSYG